MKTTLLALLLGAASAFACSSSSEADPPAAAGPASADANDAAVPGLTDDGGKLVIVCPTKPPFETTIPGLLEQCTKRVLIAGLDKTAMKLSDDDGLTWTDAALDPAMKDAQTYNYATGYGIVVAVTRGGLYTSHDAKTWTPVPFAAGYTFSGAITFAGGRFTGGGSGTYGSADGVIWAGYHDSDIYPSGARAHTDLYSVVFLGGKWILSGRDGINYDAIPDPNDGHAVVRTSGDGLSWSAPSDIGPPRAGGYSMAATETRAIAVGGDGTDEAAGVIAQTSDGVTWTEFVDKTRALRFVVSDGKRVIGFSANKTYASTDGIAWTKIGGDTPRFESAVYAESFWFARSIDRFYTSADGLAWKEVLNPGKGSYGGNTGYARLLK